MRFIKKFNEAVDKGSFSYWGNPKRVSAIDTYSKWKKNDSDDIYTVLGSGDTYVTYVKGIVNTKNDEVPEGKISDTVTNFKSNFEEIKNDKKVETIKQSYKAPSSNDITEYDFDKAIYLQDEKAIIGAFFITKRNEKSIEILNIKEIPRDSGTFMDNARPYTISISTGTLPLDKIDIIEPVDGKEGFFYIKVPYWIYKDRPELTITRIKGTYHGLKRLSLSDNELGNKDLLIKMTDPNVLNYFKGSNPDDRTLFLVDLYTRKVR